MKAVVTVIGHDEVGIIAAVSGYLAENSVNILDISQTIMADIFTMIMMVDIKNANVPFAELAEGLSKVGEKCKVSASIQSEKIFNSMHRI